MSAERSESADAWRVRLEAVIGRTTEFTDVLVLDETDSTQDAVRSVGANPGLLVVAMQQRNGRGRMGRTWDDGGGRSVTFSWAMTPREPHCLSIAIGVGVASALSGIVPDGTDIGIKWPNDILVGPRKLAGVLVEQAGGVAVAGVGINVLQDSWPARFDGLPISLTQCGCSITRLHVLEAVLPALDAALQMNEAALRDSFLRFDVLVGQEMTFCSDGRVVFGVVVSIDPTQGLRIREPDGTLTDLPAAVTTTHIPRSTTYES